MNTTSTATVLPAGPGPEAYRENAFRVTGLPVTATARDLRRREDELRMSRFGPPSRPAPLRLDPAPDRQDVEAAIQRLRDPVTRLRDELFWFWPAAADGPDPALEALTAGRVADAERLWSDPGPGPARAIATHNLAVLAHVRALDLPGTDERSRVLWRQALRHWRAVGDDAAFWELVTARVREIDDPRLGGDGAEIAERLRDRLPAYLAEMCARTAVRAAFDGAAEPARDLLAALRADGFAADAIASAVRQATGTEMAALRSLAESVAERAGAEPVRGLAEAGRLLDMAEPVVAALECVLPAEDSALGALRDEVAGTARRSVIAYCNETDEWTEPERPLLRALDLAAGEARRTAIAADLETVRTNRLYDVCWFCGERPAVEGRAYEHAMYGNVESEWYGASQRLTWQSLRVRVPRCAPCADRHSGSAAAEMAGCVAFLVAVIAGVVLLLMGLIVLGILLPVGTLMAIGAVATVREGRAARRAGPAARGFPSVVRRLESGWNHGEKPPGT